MVQKSSRHLLSLINDVLDISKIEAGQLYLAYEDFALRPLIDKSIKSMLPLAEKKGISLTMDVAEDVDIVYGDQRRIEQIILNLLSNAIKFTEKGSVHLSCILENHTCILTVQDTGIGMESDEMDNLFTPFSQIDTGLSRKYEGTGLGLSICKKLIEMMGGSIRVESKPNYGSAFTIRFAIQKGDKV